MDKNQLQEYAARVTQANRSELVVILYEAIIDSVKDSKKELLAEDIETARKDSKRACGMITELLSALDLQYTIAHYLYHLYVYAYSEICAGIAERNGEKLDHALNIFEKILPSFKEVAKQDDSSAVMKNVQSIYAGLTYGKGTLNETISVGASPNRGFEA